MMFRGHAVRFDAGWARLVSLSLTVTFGAAGSAAFRLAQATVEPVQRGVPMRERNRDGAKHLPPLQLSVSTPEPCSGHGLQQGRPATPRNRTCRSSTGISGDELGPDRKGLAVIGVMDDRRDRRLRGKWEAWGQRTQTTRKSELDPGTAVVGSKVATTVEWYMGITSLLLAEADANGHGKASRGRYRAYRRTCRWRMRIEM